MIHYYFSVFPMEALIASELGPSEFGAYMAVGTRKGSAERLIFVEVDGEWGDDFDWAYAKENCVHHENGEPKHSLYLGVYRILERIPFKALRSLYLTTRDGRSLELEKCEYVPPVQDRNFFIYKELCPVSPLVVSALDPIKFGQKMIEPSNKVYVPKIAYTDLKMIDYNNPELTGNIGSLYDRKADHLKECIESVTSGKAKASKVFDRSQRESFTFQLIQHGIYFSSTDEMAFYRMKTGEELFMSHYDWARSALIL